VAIAANIVLGEPRFDGDVVARELSRRFVEWHPRWRVLPRVNRFPRDDATMPWAMSNYLREHGISANLRARGTLDQLQRAFTHSKPVIVIIGQWTYRRGWRWLPWAHAKVLIGATPEHVVAIDPAASFVGAPQLSHQPLDEFLTQWRSMGKLWIEVG
jgi:hypothetical protein